MTIVKSKSTYSSKAELLGLSDNKKIKGGDKEVLHKPKLALHLVVPQFVQAIAQVLTKGGMKYSPHNWEKGISYEVVYGALQRHLHAWYTGEENDSEWGYSHLAHAGCCLMFLFWYQFSGKYKKFDDRAFKLDSRALTKVD